MPTEGEDGVSHASEKLLVVLGACMGHMAMLKHASSQQEVPPINSQASSQATIFEAKCSWGIWGNFRCRFKCGFV